ncbi:MAG: cation:proton antiporter [Acidobacteria bacterium]|nr:cation:proton antiporter [Acidobacteriota bacterium]
MASEMHPLSGVRPPVLCLIATLVACGQARELRHEGIAEELEPEPLRDFLASPAAARYPTMLASLVLAWLVFRVRLARTRLAQTGEGLAAIAITLTSYAITEMVNGYGFLAVFIAALMIRHYEKEHEYHKTMHAVADNVERLLMVMVLVVFGGVLANGLLAPLTWPAALAGLAFIFLVRPLAGIIGLAGMNVPFRHRAAIAFFGIRGVGSFYYLAYVLNRIDLAEGRLLWAIVGFVVLVSIVVHGITAVPLLRLAEKKT